ncbi:hypothetical protein P8452_37334 [Trifolium repens]|nr:hypothetical protein P8452_37334 [Trifolium repens]
MTDLEANANMNNRKRKQKNHNQPQKSSKLHRSEHAQKPQDPGISSTPWNNLQLILCIQDKHLDLHSKVSQAFNFVQSRVDGGSFLSL